MKPSVRLLLALLLCLLPLPTAAVGGAGEPGTPAGLAVKPVSIPMGMTYTGATVQVDAEVPAGYEAVVRVMGTVETLEMKRKGKVGRVLWMSVGEATFEAVPVVYFLLTSAPLAGAVSAGVLREWSLGYEALASRSGPASGLYPELIKLKEKEGCFLVGEGRLVRSGSGSGGPTDRMTGAFRFPSRAPAGEYAVDLFGLHAGRALHLRSATLRLDYTGIARVLRSAAMEHGLLYGGMAIVVAVCAGLATGFVFHPKRGKGK